MTQPQVAVGITADDKTARGLNSVEKRTAATMKRIGKGSEAQTSSLARGTRGLLGTVTKMEQATSRLFGGSSLTGGVTSKLNTIGEAAGVARTGMLGAAEAGSIFEGTLVGIGGAAAVTVGTVAAVAAGMYKLADGWGKGANQLGNLSSLIGVSTKGLQEFAGAAERVGVSKDVATGAVGSLSQTLNDARYGRNNAALAILGKMGVKLQTNADGTVNTDAMIPAIATALQGQNSSGRRTAARALGIPEAALAAFTQGGTKLKADMADYGRNGAMMSDDDTKLGRDLTHRDVSGEQRIGKGWLALQRANATAVRATGDAIIAGADRMSKLNPPSLIGAAEAQEMPPAGSVDGIGGASGSGFARRAGRPHARMLRLTDQGIEDLKKTVDTEWDHRSIGQGRGIVDTILNREASGHWGNSVRSVVDGYKQFSNINGRVAWQDGRHSVRDIHRRVTPQTNSMVDEWLRARAGGEPSSIGDNLDYANPYGADTVNLPWINKLPLVRGSGRSIHRHGTTAGHEAYRPGDFGVSMPIDVNVQVSDVRSSAIVTTKVGRNGSPKVSMAHDSR